MWNEKRLALAAEYAFENRKFIVVSNREPYVHNRQDGKVVCTCPAGGLTSALRPVVSAVHGTWVAQATGSADHLASSPKGRVSVPPDKPEFTLRRLWIPDSIGRAYYDGLANQALWPLCHYVYQRPVFRESDWQAYREANQLFADAVLDEAAGQPATVFVQDYHLALLPRMLRDRNPRITVAQFWHIPWPPLEAMRTFPWLDELIDGLLGNDLIGFHLDTHCANFLAAVEEVTGSERDPAFGGIHTSTGSTAVRSVPISIDFDQHERTASSSAVDSAMTAWRARLGSVPCIGIGIDRCDYTKGIPERLRAINSLFEGNPTLRGKFSFVQVAVPSRTGVPEYGCLDESVQREADAVNTRWGTDAWKPVLLERRNLPPAEMMALHRLARFCMVTPLHDGMNLVAKEFVASRFDGDGVLILSRFAGAAAELRSSLLVNPYSETSLCSAVDAALSMPEPERRARMAHSRAIVRANNIYRWSGTFLQHLQRVTRSRGTSAAQIANVA